ncbi:ribosomal protein S5 domain 2-type protein [Pterulicium gracile]|uniref:Ribosomal protein S5 domain 2-type protein n=1 Tax=Pterulicium gracile TaxID=1884261 RepID=A0A5C3QX65_9AGAR|nr:ribosomal protein S5 domain 2-type protein [Pterula gracilis]
MAFQPVGPHTTAIPDVDNNTTHCIMSPTLDHLIAQRSDNPSLQEVTSELQVLQSIYGDDAVQLWSPAHSEHPDAIRVRIDLNLTPPFEDVPLALLATLPPSYPEDSPPQLQLLTRYIGDYQADPDIFGTVLRTFISVKGVEWTGSVCIFDGIQSALEKCTSWYQEKISEKAARRLEKEDAAKNVTDSGKPSSSTTTSPPLQKPERLPTVQTDSHAEEELNVEIIEAEPIVDRKSLFVGRACSISDPAQVPLVLSRLLADRRISRAAHPVIHAYRCRVGDTMHQDNDDDGETAAGGRIAHLLQILEVENVLVIVTRYFGGIHLGPDRFKHISQAARNALELGGFLEQPDTAGDKRGKKTARKRGV